MTAVAVALTSDSTLQHMICVGRTTIDWIGTDDDLRRSPPSCARHLGTKAPCTTPDKIRLGHSERRCLNADALPFVPAAERMDPDAAKTAEAQIEPKLASAPPTMSLSTFTSNSPFDCSFGKPVFEAEDTAKTESASKARVAGPPVNRVVITAADSDPESDDEPGKLAAQTLSPAVRAQLDIDPSQHW